MKTLINYYKHCC